MPRIKRVKKTMISNLIKKVPKKLPEEAYTTWGVCPNCKGIFKPIDAETVIGEYCMSLQPDYYCSGRVKLISPTQMRFDFTWN